MKKPLNKAVYVLASCHSHYDYFVDQLCDKGIISKKTDEKPICIGEQLALYQIRTLRNRKLYILDDWDRYGGQYNSQFIDEIKHYLQYIHESVEVIYTDDRLLNPKSNKA